MIPFSKVTRKSCGLWTAEPNAFATPVRTTAEHGRAAKEHPDEGEGDQRERDQTRREASGVSVSEPIGSPDGAIRTNVAGRFQWCERSLTPPGGHA